MHAGIDCLGDLNDRRLTLAQALIALAQPIENFPDLGIQFIRLEQQFGGLFLLLRIQRFLKAQKRLDRGANFFGAFTAGGNPRPSQLPHQPLRRRSTPASMYVRA